MRNRSVIFGAFSIYAFLLILIYIVLSVFFTPPMLIAIGITLGGAGQSDEIQNAFNEGRSGLIPLGLSLAMVGLAPNFPLLQRFERQFRYLAHWFSGIPAHLLHGCRALNARYLDLPMDESGLLIPDREWSRMRLIFDLAAKTLHDPNDFVRDYQKIIAYKIWFIDQELNAPDRYPSPNIVRNQDDIAARIDQLVLGLDMLSSFNDSASANGADENAEAKAASAKKLRALWEKSAEEADKLAADICGMLMLHLEHDLLKPVDGNSAEGKKAWKTLNQFLDGIGESADRRALVRAIWSRVTAVVAFVGAVWGLFLANHENCLNNEGCVENLALVNAFFLCISALVVYSLAIFIALSFHDHWVNEEGKKKWPNFYEDDWTRWMGPASKVFLYSFIGSLFCVVAYNLYLTIYRHGFLKVTDKFLAAIEGAALHDGPMAILGPILALFIIVLIDAWRHNDLARRKRKIIILGVAFLAVSGALSSALAQQYVLFARGVPLLSVLDLLREPSVLLAGCRTAIVGLAVMYICQRLLTLGMRPVAVNPVPVGEKPPSN